MEASNENSIEKTATNPKEAEKLQNIQLEENTTEEKNAKKGTIF